MRTLHSSISKKAIMAVSGLLLLGFVLGHLLGNLTLFLGPEAINAYAVKLRSLGPGLWVVRFILLSILSAHIITAILITRENRAARPVAYAKFKPMETTYAARTMMLSGIIIFAYVVYHLMHFTFRVTNPDISHMTDSHGYHDVYSMVVLSFQQLPISAVYIAAMAILCMHLSHGISSMFQSLGFNDDRFLPMTKKISYTVSILIFIGYTSIPVSCLLGLVKPLGGGH